MCLRIKDVDFDRYVIVVREAKGSRGGVVMLPRSLGSDPHGQLRGCPWPEFPHAAIHTGSLADADFRPSTLRWVLEIHLRDPLGRFGAFFEDMLLEERFYDA